MRSRVVRGAFILLLAWLASNPQGWIPPRAISPQAQASVPAGYVEETAGVRVLYVQGSAYEMGLQQGHLLRNEVRSLLSTCLYQDLVLCGDVSHTRLLAYTRHIEEALPASLRAEMQGIAVGAGLSYTDVLLLNTVPDLRSLARGLPGLPASPESSRTPIASFGSAFAAWGNSTLDGSLVLGYNLHGAIENPWAGHLIAIMRRPARGQASISLSAAGTVGTWVGFNEEGVSVALLSSPSVDVAAQGWPLPFVLREVLEGSASLDSAINTLLTSPRLCGGNVVMGDGKVPTAAAIELSAHRHAVFEVQIPDCVLARTNHFLDPNLALSQQEILSAEERGTSLSNLRRWQDLLHYNSGWIGVDKGLILLQANHSTGTTYPLQSVLMCPGDLTLWAALRGDENALGNFVFLDLERALRGQL